MKIILMYDLIFLFFDFHENKVYWTSFWKKAYWNKNPTEMSSEMTECLLANIHKIRLIRGSRKLSVSNCATFTVERIRVLTDGDSASSLKRLLKWSASVLNAGTALLCTHKALNLCYEGIVTLAFNCFT